MKKAIVNKSTSIIKTTNNYFLPIYNVYSLNSKRRWCLQREIHAPVWASHTVQRGITSKWDHNIPLLITGSGNMVFLNFHIKSKRQWRKIKNKTLGQNVITLLFQQSIFRLPGAILQQHRRMEFTIHNWYVII